MSRHLTAVTIALLLTVLARPVLARPGDLDRTFGVSGTVTHTPATPTPTFEETVRLQSDGKIVLAGRFSAFAVRVRRFDADGAPDAGFGTGGVVDIAVAFDVRPSLAIQPDGKLVIAGGQSSVLRLNDDGSADATFGTGGLVTLPAGIAYPKDVLVQPDGKILVTGASDTPPLDFVVARLADDGTPDAGFGVGGVAHAGLTDADAGLALELQTDGKILVGGIGAPSVNERSLALVRLADDGTVDTGFGTGGAVSTLFPSDNVTDVRNVLVRPDGRIIIAGMVSFNRFVFASYLPSGTPDASFGTGGTVRTAAGFGNAKLGAAFLDPDGKLVASSGADFLGVAGIARFATDGTPDPTFGQGGSAITFVFGRSAGVVRLPDGRLLYDNNGILFRRFGGTCGDGVTQADEDCDDGNTAGGDGCDASCCTVDVDGDGTCDAVDPCVGPSAVTTPKVVVDRLSTGGPTQRLTFKGQLHLPVPVSPPFDPLTNGLRFELSTPARSVVDAVIPGGAVSGAPAVGWSLRVTGGKKRWLYVDKRSGALVGVTYAATILESSVTPGLLKFTIKGKNAFGLFGRLADDFPVSGLLVVDLPLASSGQCGTVAFPGPPPAPSCTVTTRLTCR